MTDLSEAGGRVDASYYGTHQSSSQFYSRQVSPNYSGSNTNTKTHENQDKDDQIFGPAVNPAGKPSQSGYSSTNTGNSGTVLLGL